MTSPRLSAEQRRALTMLASIPPHGIAEELLILAHRFDRTMIAGLVHGGLAMEQQRRRSRHTFGVNNDPNSELPVLIVFNFRGVMSPPRGATSR
jgi:hypothetical protein